MRRIAVVCAFLAGRNTGMYTVDRAAFEFFRGFRGQAEVTFYTLGDPGRAGFGPDELGFSYISLNDNEADFLTSDLIVYWGDFVHARSYWNADLLPRLIEQGLAVDQSAAVDLAYALFMLEGAPQELLARVVIFGGTIITNTASQLADERYRAGLDRLLRFAGGVFFRDSISAAYAAQLRGDKATQGSDCALLLPDTLPEANKSHGGLGVFFGRASWIAHALIFARLLGARTALAPRWIPWLPSAKRHWIVARSLGFNAVRDGLPAEGILAEVKSCTAVVSDTYHLCVNAWRMGVPAICIGRGAELINHTLGDKKKESFYAMAGASEFYIYREEIMRRFGLGGAVTRAAALVLDTSAVAVVSSNVQRQGETARKRLMSACRDVLAS